MACVALLAAADAVVAVDRGTVQAVLQRVDNRSGDEATRPTTHAESSPSGIEGEIVLGPINPVEHEGVVNRRPYEATITVLDEKGEIVTRFQSDANGHFRVPLKPGTYTLQPQAKGPYPRAFKQVITVSVGEFTRVTIGFDSGIRGAQRR